MTLAVPPPPWTEQARCAQPDVDPELFFPGVGDHRSIDTALDLCRTQCTVSDACLAYALEVEGNQEVWRNDPGIYGVWGGTTAFERRKVRRRQREQQERAT